MRHKGVEPKLADARTEIERLSKALTRDGCTSHAPGGIRALGLSGGRVPCRVDAATKTGLLELIDRAMKDDWSHRRALRGPWSSKRPGHGAGGSAPLGPSPRRQCRRRPRRASPSPRGGDRGGGDLRGMGPRSTAPTASWPTAARNSTVCGFRRRASSASWLLRGCICGGEAVPAPRRGSPSLSGRPT